MVNVVPPRPARPRSSPRLRWLLAGDGHQLSDASLENRSGRGTPVAVRGPLQGTPGFPRVQNKLPLRSSQAPRQLK